MSSILLVYFYFFYLLFLAILTWLNFFTPLILTIIRAIYLLVIIYNVGTVNIFKLTDLRRKGAYIPDPNS